MRALFWLTKQQVCQIELCFSLSRGVPRVDDRRSARMRRWRWGIAALRCEVVSSAGGMAPSPLSRSPGLPTRRYWSFAEREEMTLCRAQNLGMRGIAHWSGRAPLMVSREPRRNAATPGRTMACGAGDALPESREADDEARNAVLCGDPAAVAARGGVAVPGPAVPWKGRWSEHAKTGVGEWHGAHDRFPGDIGSITLAARQKASVACVPSTQSSVMRRVGLRVGQTAATSAFSAISGANQA